MLKAAAAILAGTLLLAAVLAFQAKLARPELASIAAYNMKVLPPVFLANVLLGYGFLSAYGTVGSLSFVAAAQAFAYQLAVFLLAKAVLGDAGSPAAAVAGFLLIAAGVWLVGVSAR